MIPDPQILFRSIVEMLVPVLAGYIGVKTRVIDEKATKILSAVLLYITNPLLLVTAFNAVPFSEENLKTGLVVMLATLITYIVAAAVAAGVTAPIRDPATGRVTENSLIFSNCGFFGLPVLSAVYGATGLFWGAFHLVVFKIINWSYGVFVLRRAAPGMKWKPIKILVNVGTVSCVIGFLLYVLRVPIYEPIRAGMERVGNTCAPLSMIIVGAMIAELPLKKLLLTPLPYLTTAIKQLGIPLIVGLLLRLVGFSDEIATFSALMTALPCATTTAMFARNFDLRPELAAQTVGISTVFSFLTAPLAMRTLTWLLAALFPNA